jgi:hypothetical protein
MGKTAKNVLVLWFAAALSVVGFVAGFNFGVDPFGYFGRNTIGYYFSSERQFKFNIVRRDDYNAIVLGDSRIAFTDTSLIARPGYSFVNGGIAGASLGEQLALLSTSRLDRLKLAVFGLQYSDLGDCSEKKFAQRDSESLGALRFAASWLQLTYAIEGLIARAKGESPKYHADGTRSPISKLIVELGVEGKTPRYWRKIERDLPDSPKAAPRFELGAECRQLLRTIRELADQHGFVLVVVFLPKNSDFLNRVNWNGPDARSEIGAFLSQVGQLVPHVVDLSISSFSDSANFWLDDSTHFKPAIGARIVEEVIDRSFGAQASK